MRNSRNIEQLLKIYEPENYKLIIKPIVREKQKRKNYCGCSGEYPSHYDIDVEYWNNVLNITEID